MMKVNNNFYYDFLNHVVLFPSVKYIHKGCLARGRTTSQRATFLDQHCSNRKEKHEDKPSSHCSGKKVRIFTKIGSK